MSDIDQNISLIEINSYSLEDSGFVVNPFKHGHPGKRRNAESA